MAKVLKEDWLAVPAGEIYPVLYPAGSELKGELLARAEGLDKVTEVKASRKPAADAPVAEGGQAAAAQGN